MLFWKSWFDKKVFFIQDILNGDGNFSTFEEFQNKFGIKTNYLHYFQLMAAIPSDLKKKAMSPEVPSHEKLLYSTTVSLSPENAPVDLANMRCKHSPHENSDLRKFKGYVNLRKVTSQSLRRLYVLCKGM